jgi:hypothetical protein
MRPRYGFERRNGEFGSAEEDEAHAGLQFILRFQGLIARCVPVVTAAPLVCVTC